MRTTDKFIVKVNISGQIMYWTLNGSVTSREKAYIFDEQSMPEMFKSSLRASYVEIEYI
jgi:hypothetical protein